MTDKKRIDGFNIQGTKISRECPEECYYCGSDNIIGIEVIGALDGPIIWECQHCKEHMLKFTRNKTEKLLQQAPEIEISEKDWEEAWVNGPN
jgi:hypothetical protein